MKPTTNNPNGRPKGVPNKVTADLRQKIHSIIENNFDKIQTDIDKLEPKDRLLLIEKLQKFLDDPDEMHLFFPTTLNAYERHVIHEWCEQHSLAHESHGDGEERKIVVSKK